MTNSIPASAFVNVIPGVIGAGGNPLSLNMVAVDNSGDTSIPIGTVQKFPSLPAVQAWYGANSVQAALADKYFGGYIGATSLPSAIYFTQANAAAVAGYLRGGSVAALTLTQLQALSGTLTVAIDGVSHVSAAINLSGATSFTNAATLIQAGLDAGTPTTTATVTYDSLRAAFVITSSTTGASSTLAFPTTNSLATGLNLTQATGAVLSAGAVAATPAGTMANVANVTQNWATFITVNEPILSVKLQYAAWMQTTNQRYLYLPYDSDVTPTQGPSEPASFGAIVNAADDNGIAAIWEPTTIPGSTQVQRSVAAFAAGIAASLDFNRKGGNTTWAFRSQAGLVPAVTDLTTYQNLIANGYSCYAAVATANQNFQWFQNGQVSGIWRWVQPYVNQIYFNSQLQLALAELESRVGSIPYNRAGYTLIRQACMDTINQMLNYGAIQPGVQLSATQVQEVNLAAGANIASVLQNTGWYLQISDATPQVRAARTSPPITLWYVDGGSIQQITLNSIDVE